MEKEKNLVPTFYKTSQFAAAIGVSTKTVRRWDEDGSLKPHHRSPKGTRFYSEEQIREYLSSSNSEK